MPTNNVSPTSTPSPLRPSYSSSELPQDDATKSALVGSNTCSAPMPIVAYRDDMQAAPSGGATLMECNPTLVLTATMKWLDRQDIDVVAQTFKSLNFTLEQRRECAQYLITKDKSGVLAQNIAQFDLPVSDRLELAKLIAEKELKALANNIDKFDLSAEQKSSIINTSITFLKIPLEHQPQTKKMTTNIFIMYLSVIDTFKAIDSAKRDQLMKNPKKLGHLIKALVS